MPLPAGAARQLSAYGSAQQAVLGSGTQNVYLGERERQREPAVSIAAPVGQRDDSLPLRGRDGLLAELAGPGGPRVRVVHGLGGCGKTRLALEAAFAAQQSGAEVWWVSAAEPSVAGGGDAGAGASPRGDRRRAGAR